MTRLTIVLRLLTAASYFLPFTFFMAACDGWDIKKAYNRVEAKEVIELIRHPQKRKADEIFTDSLGKPIEIPHEKKQATTTTDTITKNRPAKLIDRVILGTMMPTEQSVSAIGAMYFFKNEFGRYSVIASLIVLGLVILPFRFLTKYRIKFYLLCLQTTVLVAVIADCLVSDIDMLWGLWLMTFLVISQLVLEFWNLKHSIHP